MSVRWPKRARGVDRWSGTSSRRFSRSSTRSGTAWDKFKTLSEELNVEQVGLVPERDKFKTLSEELKVELSSYVTKDLEAGLQRAGARQTE